MFLNIAVHPNGGGTDTPDPPIVQHWNTAGEANATWSLGRKAPANCIVRNDKTISREHLRISVVAKDRDNTQYTVSITNMGKLGSFLVVPDDDNDSTSTSNTADDNGNDSDATPVDNHAISQASASQAIASEVPISDVSRRYLSSKKAHLQPIDMNQTRDVVLSTSDPHRPILLQCGRSSTTIVVSFVSIAVSGNPAKQAANPIDGVHLLVTEHVHPLFTACVVTSKRSVCTKQLTAYCSNISLVHPSFLSAIVACCDGGGGTWPAPTAHAPKPDTYAFWDEAPHDRTLWKACTFVRVHGNAAVEQLVEAAGVGLVVDVDTVLAAGANDYVHLFAVQSSSAKVGKLKKDMNVPTVTAKEIAKAITERRLLQDAKGEDIGVSYDATAATETDPTTEVKTPIEEKEQVACTEKPSPVKVAPTTKPTEKPAPAEISKKSAKAKKPVETHPFPPPAEKEDVNNIRPVPPTSSQTSNSQSQSRSLKKWEIDDSSDEDIALTTTKSQPAPKISATPVSVAPAAASQPAPRVVASGSSPTSEWQTASQRHDDDDDSDGDDAKTSPKTVKKRPRGVRRKGGRRWDDSSDEDESSRVKCLKSLSFVSDAKPPPEDAMEIDEMAPPPSSRPPSAMKPSARRRETPKLSPPKRTVVAVAPDAGWLTILPKERARSRKEIMDITGNTELIGEPITEFAPSLLKNKASQQQLRPVTPTASNGPNYKAFRKNAVPSVYSGPTIELRAVAEPLSVSMVEANHATNTALAAQQRINDALFAGPASLGIASKARRRR